MLTETNRCDWRAGRVGVFEAVGCDLGVAGFWGAGVSGFFNVVWVYGEEELTVSIVS